MKKNILIESWAKRIDTSINSILCEEVKEDDDFVKEANSNCDLDDLPPSQSLRSDPEDDPNHLYVNEPDFDDDEEDNKSKLKEEEETDKKTEDAENGDGNKEAVMSVLKNFILSYENYCDARNEFKKADREVEDAVDNRHSWGRYSNRSSDREYDDMMDCKRIWLHDCDSLRDALNKEMNLNITKVGCWNCRIDGVFYFYAKREDGKYLTFNDKLENLTPEGTSNDGDYFDKIYKEAKAQNKVTLFETCSNKKDKNKTVKESDDSRPDDFSTRDKSDEVNLKANIEDASNEISKNPSATAVLAASYINKREALYIKRDPYNKLDKLIRRISMSLNSQNDRFADRFFNKSIPKNDEEVYESKDKAEDQTIKESDEISFETVKKDFESAISLAKTIKDGKSDESDKKEMYRYIDSISKDLEILAGLDPSSEDKPIDPGDEKDLPFESKKKK